MQFEEVRMKDCIFYQIKYHTNIYKHEKINIQQSKVNTLFKDQENIFKIICGHEKDRFIKNNNKVN